MRTLKFKRYTKGQPFNPETAERDTLHFVVIKDSPLVVNVYDVDAKGNVALISGEDVTKVLNGFREKSVDSWTEITGLNNNENSIITLTHNRGRYIVNSSKNSLKIVGFHLMPDSGVYDGMPISIKNNSQGPITIDSIPNPDSIYHIIDSDILPMQIEKGYTAMFAFNFDSKTVELIKTSEKGPTKTSDLTNDGEDGSYPYLTVQDINWVVSKVGINEIDDNYAWSVESASGRSFKMTDYNSIMINHNGNRIEIDENDMLYMTAHDNIKAYTPYFEVEGEFNVILGSSSSKFFRFNEAITTTVTTPRTLHTDGTNVKYTGNDGVPRTLAFANQPVMTILAHTSLSSVHNNMILRVVNSVTITIPTGLPTDFNCVVDAYGTAVVTFVFASGVTYNAPTGLILANNNMCNLYCIGTSNSYRLNGGMVETYTELLTQTISTDTTLSDAWHGAYVRITGNCIITIPLGLRNDFECFFDVIGDFTAQFVFTAGIAHTAPYGKFLKQDCTAMLKMFATNNGRLTGDLLTS